MARPSARRDLLFRPVFAWAQNALPHMSATEAQAIAAGNVWWDAALFTERFRPAPGWSRLT